MISRNIIILLLTSFISLAFAKSNNEIEKISLKHAQNSTINNFENRPYYLIDEITPCPEEKILPFTNCEIRFYGNGKLVRLEDNNGESCLKSEIIENGKSVIYTYPLFYHKPKNSSELEIIR